MRQNSLISDLRHRVRIERPVQTSDGAGGFDVSWQEVATIWAALTPFSRGGERVTDEQITEQRQLKMTIRHRTDIDHTMRVFVDGEFWNLRTVVDPDFSKTRLECVLEQGVAL